MLEAVINVSEGKDAQVLEKLKKVCKESLLDVHIDKWHNRSVFTLAGENLEQDVRQLSISAVALLDIESHSGVHPRFGVVDVVPFVPLQDGSDVNLTEAISARDTFAKWACDVLNVPVGIYGPERSLPELRRLLRGGSKVEYEPNHVNKKAGFICAGARHTLVAYNVWLDGIVLEDAKEIASSIRSDEIRALALEVGESIQISCNLVMPWVVTPVLVFNAIKSMTHDMGGGVLRGEVVGLIPNFVLRNLSKKDLKLCGIEDFHILENRVNAIK